MKTKTINNKKAGKNSLLFFNYYLKNNHYAQKYGENAQKSTCAIGQLTKKHTNLLT